MNRVHFLIMDVDGTLTDGKIYMGQDGEIMKAFSCKDGYAITEMLPKMGIIPIIITGRSSEIVNNRCIELGVIECNQGIKDKSKKIKEILDSYSLRDGIIYTPLNVAYVGDDMNDFECMNYIQSYNGIVGCPADAAKEVVEISDFVSIKNGGCGVVREFVEWLINNYD